jgi:iron complex transport system substrate-binding protein
LSTYARRATHSAASPALAHRARAGRVACVLASALLAAGCAGRDAARTEASSSVTSTTIALVDDAHQPLRLQAPARRIVSLIPSATETLMAIGARDRLVGRTDFDTGPAVDSLPSVGGGLDPSLEAIAALKPDLVLGWKSATDHTMHERLAALGIPFYAVRAEDTTDVYRTIRSLGVLTARTPAADSLAHSLRTELAALHASVQGRPAPSVFFLVWNDPPMTAGPDTFISQLLGVAGGANLFGDQAQPWPNVAMEEILRRDPDWLVLPQGEKGGANSVERLRTATGWRELRAMKSGHIITLPSDLVNRPGPHMAEAARRLRDGLHPELAGR